MNLQNILYFHLNGLISGLFFSAFLMVIIFLVVFLLKQRQTELFRLMLLCCFCFICFWLFNIYFQASLLPLDSIYPSWILDATKIALPVGLIFFTKVLVQMSQLSSATSYLIYQKFKPFITILYGLSVLAIISFLFISNHLTVIGLTEILLAYASLLGGLYCLRIIKPPMGSVLGVGLLFGCLSFLVIAFVLFVKPPNNLLVVFTTESFIVGLTMIFMTMYFVIYGYHELHTYDEYISYDWRNLIKNIHIAVDQNQFFLVYQPKVNIVTNEIVGVEALLRWQHPEHGLIMPNNFIPLSEKSHLIDTICQWLIKHSIKQAKEFTEKGLDLPISINFSVKNLHPKMIKFLQNTLTEYGVSTDRLMIEITESIFIAQTQAEKKAISMLQEMGVNVSLDDYGTGYSSLSTMQSMTINELKIDRSFVKDMLTNHEDSIIVESIIYMTKRLGMTVVAEGIEDEQLLEKLKEMGCEVGQGYGLAKPMPVEKLNQWMVSSSYKLLQA